MSEFEVGEAGIDEIGRRRQQQYQAIADTSVELSEEEDPAVVRERLKRIRKQLAEARRTGQDSSWFLPVDESADRQPGSGPDFS
jgi:hypothetical protein